MNQGAKQDAQQLIQVVTYGLIVKKGIYPGTNGRGYKEGR